MKDELASVSPCREIEDRESRGDSHARTRYMISRRALSLGLWSHVVVTRRGLAPSACSRGRIEDKNLEVLHDSSSFIRVGVLQIGIRAWLQHLAYLGSWMSCIKTTLRGLKGDILLYSLPKKSG